MTRSRQRFTYTRLALYYSLRGTFSASDGRTIHFRAIATLALNASKRPSQ